MEQGAQVPGTRAGYVSLVLQGAEEGRQQNHAGKNLDPPVFSCPCMEDAFSFSCISEIEGSTVPDTRRCGRLSLAQLIHGQGAFHGGLWRETCMNLEIGRKRLFQTVVTRMKSYVHQARRYLLAETSASYWTRYNVTMHRSFQTAGDSLAYFHWRNDQYIDYIKLMPVEGQDGKTVLDYGCGPGNDLVGFETYSKPARLIGVDVSPTSLEQARQRLYLHRSKAEYILISEVDTALPFDDCSFDYIHSSGVIHHIKDPVPVLVELKRILRPSGEMRVMVYNYDSLFLHLHVAYIARLVKGLYRNIPIRDAFRRFTDGEECPISTVYKPEEFTQLANSIGLNCEFIGASISVKELADLNMRWQAVMHPELEEEHRQFLINLCINERGLPMFNNMIAGHDGCYRLRHWKK